MGEPFTVLPPAGDPAEVRRRHDSNRAAWDQGAAAYTADDEEAVAFLRAGGSNLHPVERRNLGDLRSWCEVAVHLQCASGRDTLSLLNEGLRRVVGVDISQVHVDNARRRAAALDAAATFVCCDVLDTPAELDATADLVYTGRGALNWIHDLDAWAAVVARLLRPGGVVSVLDNHPCTWLFDVDATTLVATGLDYFDHADTSKGWPDRYIGDLGLGDDELAALHERCWAPSAVFTALTGAGLVVEVFGEHREGYWDEFPELDPALRATLALTYSFIARRPRR